MPKLNHSSRPDVRSITQRIHMTTQREGYAMRDGHWG
jgi:hypothetical protein